MIPALPLEAHDLRRPVDHRRRPSSAVSAAGAGAAHLIYTQGHKYGLELRPSARASRRRSPPTPEDYDARDPGRGRLARRSAPHSPKGWVDIGWRTAGAYFGDRVGFVSGGVTFFILLSLFPTPGRLRHHLRPVRRSGRRLEAAGLPVFGPAANVAQFLGGGDDAAGGRIDRPS